MIGAFAFLTVAGRSRTPSPQDLVWFPAVGAVLGAVLGLVWWGAAEIWPPLVAGALVVVADLVLTGMLHLDGVADSADGLLPHLDRERRLAVMAAPDVGAFGVAAVSATLLVRWSAVVALPVGGWRAVVLLAALWAASRSAMVLVVATQPYARATGGLAAAFVPRGATRAGTATTAGVACAGAAAAAAAVTGVSGAVGVVAGLAAGGLVVALAHRRLGGFTGDVLGLLGVTVETVGLVLLAADG